MEQIVQILKDLQVVILLALPTALLVVVLHWFLKKMLFQPLDRVIEERYRRTQGALEAGQAALATAKERLAAYEKALGDARAEIFSEHEAARKSLADEHARAVEAARARAAGQVAAARSEIAGDADAARAGLRAESERLAEQIAGSLIAGGVQ